MQTLRATDAISPAFARTRLILFSPFRKGRTWKLAATAYLATLCTLFVPFPLFYLAFIPRLQRLGSAAVSFAVLAILILTGLYLIVFYLCSRLRFALFDIVVNREEFVAPAWRRYASASFKWTVFKVLLGSILTAVFALPTITAFQHVATIMRSIQPGQPPPPNLLLSIFAGYALVYLVVGLAFFAIGLLGDFLVPSLALENTTLAEAFRRFGRLIAQEPAEFLFYTLAKFGMGLVGYLAALIAFQIVFLVALLVVGLVAGAIGFLLHLIGVPTGLLIVLAAVLGIVFYLFFIVYVLLLLIGTVLVFLESYALCFLGGRYPILGDLLDRSTPWPTQPWAPNPGPYFPPPPAPETSL